MNGMHVDIFGVRGHGIRCSIEFRGGQLAVLLHMSLLEENTSWRAFLTWWL